MLTVATTPGVKRSGTYVVKVHSRTTHSRTEFPRANPPPSPTKQPRRAEPTTPHQDQYDTEEDDKAEDEPRAPRLKEVNFTPKDNSRIYALRRDPSVVSLLNMYDDNGCLDVHAFANTPPTPAPVSTEVEGRQPRPRTGSTLRQLLGEPQATFTEHTHEGDISWAEHFLESVRTLRLFFIMHATDGRFTANDFMTTLHYPRPPRWLSRHLKTFFSPTIFRHHASLR